MGRENGSRTLQQRVIRFARGVSAPQELVGEQAVIYVAAGRGTLRADGDEVALQPDTGVYVAAGETYRVENAGPEELLAVVVTAPQARSVPPEGSRAIRFSDR